MSNRNTEDIIGALYDLIQDARSVPLAPDKCIVERDRVLDMLDELIDRFGDPTKPVMHLLEVGGAEGIYRDTFHAGYGLGRYAIGLLWFKLFTGRDVINNTFSSLDEQVSEKALKIARECAETLSFE